MNLIINDNNFSINNILLKQSKRSTKIIYAFKSINIIGLSFTLKSLDYKYNNNFLYIKLKDKIQVDNLKKIDKYLKENIINYDTFIKDNIIKINDNIDNKIKNKLSINININSLKSINNKNKVQIFII